jgi:hypothetical protein
MSTTLRMLALNAPLSQWRSFEDEHREEGAYGASHHLGWNGTKNTEKMARAIFSALSHDEAVALVAREFDGYPSDLRLILRTLCNDGDGSGNVRKGVQRLDRLMGGKLLRADQHVERFRARTRDGWRSKEVNPAVAGATKKYGIIK